MKVLILYSARSGTNSIASYFMKQNTEYIYYNQPWSKYNQEEGIKYVPYSETIKEKNILVKSEISTLTDKIKEDIKKDFDKIVLISRKNKREQVISFYLAQSNFDFLNKEKRDYFIEGLNENIISNFEIEFNQKETILKEYETYGAKLFYYEDLFYGEAMPELLKFLNLEFIQKDYDEILDKKNKYKSGELKSKKTISII